jgi:geranylgeranyl pyrophosphate synthase
MAAGELQEEFLKGSVEVSVEAYLGIASRKTGALFEWCGKVLSEISPLPHEAADPPRLALSAGILLQVVDDIHDFILSDDVSGKPAAQDLVNHRLTLPCILALENPKTRSNFLDLLSAAEKNSSNIQDAVNFVRDNGFLDESRAKGREIVDSMKALCRDLPSRNEARDLSLFIEIMARREF